MLLRRRPLPALPARESATRANRDDNGFANQFFADLGRPSGDPHPDEQTILTAAPEIAPYVADLKRKSRKVIGLMLRQLLRMLREYPREPFLGAIAEATQYGLYDLDRVERMILRRVQRDFFLLEGNNDD